MSKTILLTGANGFVGQFLGHYLNNHHYNLVHTLRHPSSKKQDLADGRIEYIGNITAKTDWSKALTRIDCVIHLAARVHVMKETAANPLQAFQQTNLHGTVNLAKQAIQAGVKRFIYLSSIKVNGEKTQNVSFQADDPEQQLNDSYALSKQQTEKALLELHQQGLIEVVIIRPPLVYGPGVKGNFLRLIKLVEKQWPLPLDKINNQRSLVSVNNLSSLIQTCIEHQQASGEVFLVSDGNDLSSSELFSHLADILGCKNRLFYFPRNILKVLTTFLGKSKEFERLFNSLRVDIKKNQQLLGWQPDTNAHSALQQTVEQYKNQKDGAMSQ